ncbi:MAG: HAMP domain-containing sensor histidine kinase [Pseudomonadota bacterium]
MRDMGPKIWRGLSGRTLSITLSLALVVQLAVLSSVFVTRWSDSLNERLAAALVAAFVQEAAGAKMVSEPLQMELLKVTGVHSIVLKKEDFRQLVLTDGRIVPINGRVDLRSAGFFMRFYEALQTLRRGGKGDLQVIGPIQKMPGEFIEIVLSEGDLYAEVKAVLINGLVNAFAFAALIGLALFWLLRRSLVVPVERLTGAMIRFAEDPEDPFNTLTAWNRYDEIGTAAKQLRDLQLRLRNLLGEKKRLADLGAAVARINHDLRNLFATMQLVSDTLERVDDPRVQRAAPRLVRALERGINLCEATLEYGRTGDIETHAALHPLRPTIEEAIDQFRNGHGSINFDINIATSLSAVFDPDHLFRIVSNLTRNALSALPDAGAITLAAERQKASVILSIIDTGPGIPDIVRKTLFDAFGKSASRGGSGLGLAISRELARAMHGELTLEQTGPEGTRFDLSLPFE